MFLKQIKRKNIFKLTAMPIFLVASLLSILFSSQFSTTAYAATYMGLTISEENIDFHFNQAENAASAFKRDHTTVRCNTNSITGFAAYVSSIDEDTNLNHTDPSVTQKITSITSMGDESSFNSKNWGYLPQHPLMQNNIFIPIPKASQPDLAFQTHYKGPESFFLNFGVKTGPDLPSGTYSKKILVTAVTNHVPTSTVLIPGQNFRDAIVNLGPTGVVKSFKRANAAPPAGTATTVVSTADSEVPAYSWYDPAAQSILWWSDADTVYANEDSGQMFFSLGDLERINMTGINTSRVKNMSAMFHSGNNIYKHIELSNFDTSNAEDMSYMFGTSGTRTMENVDPIDFSSFDTSKVTNMEDMFDGSYLPSIDIHNFNTSNVTSMKFMFAKLGRPTTLNLSGLDVRSLTDLDTFFYGSRSMITSLDLSGWDLSHIDYMGMLFAGMENLEYLNLQDFKTTSITNMKAMFQGVKKLRNLDLSSFDTSQVTDMSSMFEDMESLTTINLSSFNTSNVTDMSQMFAMTIANPPISSLDLSNFDTSNVTNMAEMFEGLSNLTELKIQSFNTKKVTNMYRMFYWSFMTPANGTLDISSFDTRSLTNGEAMFQYMKVKTIYASPSFTTNLITSPMSFFMDNDNLTGANGTTWDYSKQDRVYARIDTPGNPGFFTQKP